jgi:hypothetical protein
MEKVESFIPIVSSMKVIGYKEKCMEEVHIDIRMVQFTLGIGEKISLKAKVYKAVIINLHTLVNTAMV